MPRFAAIDVGSNAIRLRVVDAQAPTPSREERARIAAATGVRETPSPFKEVTSSRAAVRLGAEVFVSGRLAPQSIQAACAAFRDFRTTMDAAKIDATRAIATSAVREADNSATLVERARRETGIELAVIEGAEEARLIQLAVQRRLYLDDLKVLLVDVGGGSTELTVLDRGRVSFAISLPLGTVRLLETYLRDREAIGGDERRLVEEGIVRALDEAGPILTETKFDALVGTGGNIDTLVELCPRPGGFAGCVRAIDTARAKQLLDELVRMTVDERRDKYKLRPDRADTIVTATAIFTLLADRVRLPAIVAPGVGLKEGILEELSDKYFKVWSDDDEDQAILEACSRLGERFHFDRAHGERVAAFAQQLFTDLASVHGFDRRDRLLLRAAGVLHDIGDFVRYDGHHKHSQYLIQNSDIMGLTAEERTIVANLARYHRKSPPDQSHPNFRELDRNARTKVRGLAAILRIADALDREHRGKVRSVRARVDRAAGKLWLLIDGAPDRELEEWTVRKKSELFHEVYDLEVMLSSVPQAAPSSVG
jgi:exopolyphosphatase/guanosine-5'-triphosphate,3'-diphosphate pyrophosphatase